MPENRTAAEVVASSVVTVAALREAAPIGTNVIVPAVQVAVAAGNKEAVA